MDFEDFDTAQNAEALQALDAAQDILARVGRLRTPLQTKTQERYINTLRDLSTILAQASSTVRVVVNSTATVNRIPPELLAHIFSFYVTGQVRSGAYVFRAFESPDPKAAARLVEVCKHWRDVALSTGYLWSCIICGGPKATPYDRYLHRSRSNDLHVVVGGDIESVAELFRDQPSRVRYLLMLDTTENWCRRRDPRNLLDVVAPDLLECTLDLRFWPSGRLPQQSYALFSHQASKLRELVLHTTRTIPADQFPSLTHLALHDIQGSLYFSPLLALMSRCPQLRIVYIQSKKELESRFGEAAPEVVMLPDLRRITLLVEHSTLLIRHIAVPAKCLVRLGELLLDDLTHLSQPPFHQQWAAANMTRLRVQSDPTPHPIMRTYNYTIEMANSTSDGGLHFCLSIPTAFSKDSISVKIRRFIRANPIFENVTVLWTKHAPTTVFLVPAVLSVFPKLTTIGVGLDDRTRILDFSIALSNIDSDYRNICPRLAALCMYNIHYEGLKDLLDIVSHRKKRLGNPLRRLAVACTEPLQAQALELSEFVGEVIVRSRFESLPPPEWEDDPGCPDSGVWPEWDYFLKPGLDQ